MSARIPFRSSLRVGMTAHSTAFRLLAVVLLVGASAMGRAAEPIVPIHAFRGIHGGGVTPSGPLLQASDGALYGETINGGRFDSGTVFRIRPDRGFDTLTTFGLEEGSQPLGGLVEGRDGNFYGVTRNGGDFNGGTIFRITPAGGVTTLYSFDASSYGGHPASGLLRASDGLLYGVTPESGQTVEAYLFRISEGGTFEWIAPLDRGCQGYGSSGALVEDADGRLYGTASGGEACIYRMNKRGGQTIVHRFAYGEGASGLTIGSDAALYGTVLGGGRPDVCSYVYRFDADRTLTRLQEFPCDPYVAATTGVVEGSDGLFHGAADVGGVDGVVGIVFRVGRDGSFDRQPFDKRAGLYLGRLIQATDGAYYGNAVQGGRYGQGSVLRAEGGASARR